MKVRWSIRTGADRLNLMQFPHLLTLIDAELERLHEARSLLASLQHAPDPEAQMRFLASAAVFEPEIEPAVAAEREPVTPAPRSAEEVRAMGQSVPRRPPRTRAARPKPPAPAETRALGRPMQHGPIFVPAGRIQRAPGTAPKVTGARGAGQALPEEMPTAETLSRRWLQGPSSN